MATEVTICNLALSHIGDQAEITVISPPDGTAQAAHCSRYYPVARDECLSAFDWGFAKRRQPLAQISGAAPSGWGYWYTIPNPYLVARCVVAEGYDTPISYEIESHATHGTIVLCDVEKAEMGYTALITDTTKFPPGFVHALSWLLASYLALPITNKREVKAAAYEQYLITQAKAMTIDANQSKRKSRYIPGSIKARN